MLKTNIIYIKKFQSVFLALFLFCDLNTESTEKSKKKLMHEYTKNKYHTNLIPSSRNICTWMEFKKYIILSTTNFQNVSSNLYYVLVCVYLYFVHI